MVTLKILGGIDWDRPLRLAAAEALIGIAAEGPLQVQLSEEKSRLQACAGEKARDSSSDQIRSQGIPCSKRATRTAFTSEASIM
jgi:hypothetical protein